MTNREMIDKLTEITSELNGIQNQLDRENEESIADTLERCFSSLKETRQKIVIKNHNETQER